MYSFVYTYFTLVLVYMTDSVTASTAKCTLQEILIHSIKPVVYEYSSSIVYEKKFRFHNIKYSVSLKVVFSVRKCIKRRKRKTAKVTPTAPYRHKNSVKKNILGLISEQNMKHF